MPYGACALSVQRTTRSVFQISLRVVLCCEKRVVLWKISCVVTGESCTLRTKQIAPDLVPAAMYPVLLVTLLSVFCTCLDMAWGWTAPELYAHECGVTRV